MLILLNYILVLSCKKLDDNLEYIGDFLISKNLNQGKKCVAVIDAGSTGTRINIYEFYMPGYFLGSYYFNKNRPGLASIEDEISIVDKLQELLVNGVKFLNQRGCKASETQIAFNATAGFRFLPETSSTYILNLVRDILTLNEFIVKDVAVITGIAEGLLGWGSARFLRNTGSKITYKKIYSHLDEYIIEGYVITKNLEIQTIIKPWVKQRSVGIIDMGGGSVEIVYEIEDLTNEFVSQNIILTKSKSIYAHSFLGLGLVSALKEIKKDANYSYCTKSDTKSINKCENIYTKLLNKIIEKEEREFYEVNGISDVDDIYLISFFYEKILESGLTDRLTLKMIKNRFLNNCNDLTNENCKELLYIILFLQRIGLSEDKNIFVTNQLKGINLNWTLGKALVML